MEEYIDKEGDTHEEEPANQPAEAATRGAEANNGPQRRQQQNRSGKKKLFDLQRVVMKKEKELLAVAKHPRIG
jgi:hypothetical protein